jgi:hypothetical protein
MQKRADSKGAVGKITLSLSGKFLREVALTKERMTIGRMPHNDIVLDDLAISGEHAVIVTMNHDSYLEDLNSTNGTKVNGQPVRKHYLQDEDCIELAQYRAQYHVDPTFTIAAAARIASSHTLVSAHAPTARLRILNGARVGSENVLSRAITTIGKQDAHVAVILLRLDGYYLTHIEGNTFPSLNGAPIGLTPQKLKDKDVIELAGDHVQFLAG